VTEQDLYSDSHASECVSCSTCWWWAEDDDGDEHGACAILLNDLSSRGWRTRPEHSCSSWVACAASANQVTTTLVGDAGRQGSSAAFSSPTQAAGSSGPVASF
jgi:hypothetical protein